MTKLKRIHIVKRCISFMLAFILASEAFFCEQNIVLAANKEAAGIIQGTDQNNLEGVVEENSSENNSSDSEAYDTEGLDILFEVKDNRDRTSKHFRLSDGTIMAADYGMDVHYEKDGAWKDIDNRFIYEAPTAADAMEGFSTAEGNVQFKFAPDTGDGEVVRATAGDYSVGFEFLDAPLEASADADVSLMQADDTVSMEAMNSSGMEETGPVPITFIKGEILNASEAAQVLHVEENCFEPVSSYAANAVSSASEPAEEERSDITWADTGMENADTGSDGERTLMEQASLENAVTSVGYGNVTPGVSLQYIASGSSLKEYILLSERQDSYVYSFAMNLGNLEAELQEDGSILLYDPADGTAVYEIPAAYMTDAAGAYSDAVEMELAEAADGRYILTLAAEADWIDAEERVFPVQIDPTLNERLSSEDNIRGFYVIEEKPDVETEWYGWMYVGYDGNGYGNRITYIQMKDLEKLPQDSVICASYFNMAVMAWDECECPKLHVQAKRLAEKSVWDTKYCYNDRPDISSEVLDIQTLTQANLTNNEKRYVAWNITKLVKEHYEAGNQAGAVLDFALESTGGMRDGYYVNAALNLTWTGAEPVLQTFYRDTKGIEDYYTYQSQSIGNAGTGYISDYTLQLTVAKNIASYNHTAMDCGIGLVYNSACSSSYFTNGGNIHTKDFSKMQTGAGWKLTLQETVVPVSVTDLESTKEYLVYNDSDGTEHYFHYNEDKTVYEDEDGLNLTITKSGSDYTMTDKKDNKKIFKNGYLKELTDANGNKVSITYDSQNRISEVSLDTMSEGAVTIYSFAFDDSTNCLSWIKEHMTGRKYIFTYGRILDKWRLTGISRRLNEDASTDTVEAQYSYNSSNGRLTRAYDAEKKTGVEYTYYKSDTGYHVYECMEFAAGNIAGSGLSYGTKMRAWPIGMRQTRYRYHGMDQTMGTADDIVTTYLFNSSGQTINGISENGSEDELFGVTSAVYTKNSGTDKTNNRMSGSISSGQAGMNLLPNGGFERAGSPDTNGESWLHYISGGNAARKTDGENEHLAYSGKSYYNLFGGSTSAVSSIYQDVTVEAGKTYTFSAYVNTGGLVSAAADGGVYLYARQISDQQVLGESIMLDYKTGQALDGGWQRLTAVFTAPSGTAVRFTICSYHVYGIIRVDDVQMERCGAASRFNHVYNGSFETENNKTAGWELSDPLVTAVTGAADAGTKKHGRTGLRMNASAPEKNLYAQQTINLYTGADTTFLLSGWGKADSIPDLAEEIEGKNDASLRYWGITLALNYSDGAKEYFHLPFCDYATNWQYAAMSVTPKTENTGKTITTAVLKLYYKNNANTAYFDSISLIEEPSQTYKYDKEGNLISVKDSGNGEETYEFREGTMDLNKVGTKGSGDYEYVYPETGNKHLPKQIKNDNVVMDIEYDADGQTTKTKLGDDSENGSDLYMESTAVYNGGLLRKVTDNAGSYVNYGYDNKRRLIRTADAAGNAVWTQYDNTWDRPVLSYQEGFISLSNTYVNGNLTQITRNGKLAQNGTGVTQNYTFTYDAFGRNTSVSVGGYKVADYHYNGAGLLDHMDYGTTDVPQSVTEYEYDELERVKEVSHYNNWTNETMRYGYLYASDGNLAAITKNGEPAYSYEYDSLGRLIHSSMLEGGKAVLHTEHTYDTSNRILSQSWQIGDDAFTESYVYEEKDGTLKQMSSGGDTLAFTYDELKRFDTRTSEVMKVDYDYRNIDDAKTTTQVSQIRYTDKDGEENLMPVLGYAYDAVGNIRTVTSDGGTKNSYTYDAQNQLTAETIYDYKGGTLYGTYTYDTYGNIRSISSSLSGVAGESYTLEYGDASWKDRLTRVTYTKNGSTTSGTINYDQIGNPLTYFNGQKMWNFTWKFGRQLTNASGGSDVVSYTYDVDGIRQSKTVNGSTTKYTTLDGKVVRETWGNITTDYFYDNEGKPYKIEISGGAMNCVGYYVLNQQGDVIAILDDAGEVAVTYEYNAWGKVLNETGTGTLNSMHLQSYNHLKYRGYYHDGETGFYYLNSRYYDPVLGRFINADGYVPTGITFEGCNMYAYCLNNPVNMHDSNGNVPEWLEELAKYTGGLASAAAMATRYRGQKKVARDDINKSLKSYGENCKISFNDSAFEVTDSYKVSSIDFEKICVVAISVGITPRTVDNMMAEWRFHNVVYFLSLPCTPIITKKAKDASIDYIEDPRTPVKFFTYIFDVRKWD